MENNYEKQCHGCEGKGWVDSKYTGPNICPICRGSGKINKASSTIQRVTVLPLPSKTELIKRRSPRRWAFCEAIDSDGCNLKRYPSSTECWRIETGLPLDQGYQGKQNRDAVDSFIHQGWRKAFGDREHKERGMRVIRPSKT